MLSSAMLIGVTGGVAGALAPGINEAALGMLSKPTVIPVPGSLTGVEPFLSQVLSSLTVGSVPNRFS